MTFTTSVFAIFMAVVFISYYLIPKKIQWVLLLVASYIFYAYASPVYLLYLFATTLITYLGAIFVEPIKDKKKRKALIATVIILLLLMLGIFKYSQFILDTVSSILKISGKVWEAPVLNFILPVGLSFYIFMSMGYCIDVYRKKIPAEKNFFKYMLFVSFFPQLLSGPIGDYAKLAPQLTKEHTFDYEESVKGLYRIFWGVFKKFIIANRITLIIQEYTDYGRYYGFFLVLIFFLEVMQLYADFSGYTDIAIGCARMLGIKLSENFDSPYLATSISDFWRRWHITLGEWFKNYLFYSTYLSKWNSAIRKKLKKSGHTRLSATIPNIISLLIVWFSTGLWHGASWNYVIWGMCHGSVLILAVILEKQYDNFNRKYKKLSESKAFNCFRIVRTFCIMMAFEVVFYVSSVKETVNIFKNLFIKTGFNQIRMILERQTFEFFIVVVGIIVLFAVDVYYLDKNRIKISDKIRKLNPVIRWSFYVLALLFIYFCGAYRGLKDVGFVYFNF